MRATLLPGGDTITPHHPLPPGTANYPEAPSPLIEPDSVAANWRYLKGMSVATGGWKWSSPRRAPSLAGGVNWGNSGRAAGGSSADLGKGGGCDGVAR